MNNNTLSETIKRINAELGISKIYLSYEGIVDNNRIRYVAQEKSSSDEDTLKVFYEVYTDTNGVVKEVNIYNPNE